MALVKTSLQTTVKTWGIACAQCPIKRAYCAAGGFVNAFTSAPPDKFETSRCPYYEKGGYLNGQTICNYEGKKS
jgi:hypothetical protein